MKDEIMPVNNFLDNMLENKIFSIVTFYIKITNLAVCFYCSFVESNIIDN